MRGVLLLALVACSGRAAHKDAEVVGRCATTPVSGTKLALVQLAAGCTEPGAPNFPMCMDGSVTLVTSPPGDDRLFALEQVGRIRDLSRLAAPAFLDLSADAGGPVNVGGELGLLGLAFHPNYATNRTFYVYYTSRNPDPLDTANPFVDVLATYQTSATDPDRADVASGQILISIKDFASNHNGGMIEFGPDGYLYISTGDGGIGDDPLGSGQDPNSMLGKFLRIDVDRPANGKLYGIPATNPFATGGGAPEVFILGLRNPWRWSFDPATGDMWIGDVGQGGAEELDVLTPAQQPGANLGWKMYEAELCAHPPCDPTGKTFPKYQFLRAETGWNAIIGGSVYRGDCYPDIVGWYLFTDNGVGGMAVAIPQEDGSLFVDAVEGTFIGNPASLHAAARGELYETDTRGNVFHLTVVRP